jgi:hypothetical protein
MKNMTLPKILQPFYCADLIRIGKNNDGGYLVNKQDIIKSDRLVSFGIGDDISFEQDFYSFNSCDIEAYDGTVDKPASFFEGNKEFYKKNIYRNTIDCILNRSNTFLKCDIEGSEYDILDYLISNSNLFSGIVIEFHEINKYVLFNELTNFISKTNLKLVHVHANNNSYIETPTEIIPDCLELTFTSSNNIEYKKHIALPHTLDMPNEVSRLDIPIVF